MNDMTPVAGPDLPNWGDVTCDDCGEDFPLNLREIDEPAGTVRQEMVCPHCGGVYPTIRISAQGVKLRRQLDGMRARGQIGTVGYNRLQGRFRKQCTPISRRTEQEATNGG